MHREVEWSRDHAAVAGRALIGCVKKPLSVSLETDRSTTVGLGAFFGGGGSKWKGESREREKVKVAIVHSSQDRLRREAPLVFGDVSVSNGTHASYRTRHIKPVVARQDGARPLLLRL